MASPLPTPRQFLTTLIESISETQPSPAEDSRSGAQSPSKLPTSSRSLLTTLHVLFPALLLPALDLLDRSLVTAVLPFPSELPSSSAAPASQTDSPDPAKASFYLVRSAASTSRKTFNAFLAAAPYIVRLDAWNCSCANFAFEAFPAPGRGDGVPETEVDGPEREPAPEREFGGMSLDGREAGGVPCCKHLLACLLVDRWGSVLGGHVVERRAGREEMIGLVADT